MKNKINKFVADAVVDSHRLVGLAYEDPFFQSHGNILEVLGYER